MSSESKSDRVIISKRLLAVNMASSVAAKILNITVLVWLNQYLLKQIGAEEYSLYPVTISIMAFGPLLSAILTSGLGRYTLNAYARDDDEEVTRIVSTMFPILLGVGVLVAASGWWMAANIERVLSINPPQLKDARWMIGLMFLSLAIRLPLAPFGTGLFIRQRFVLDNLISVGSEFLRIGLLLLLIFLLEARVIWVVVAMTAAELSRLLIRQVISRKLVPSLRFSPKLIEWNRSRELISFGSWNLVAKTADTIRTSADPLILNKMAGAFEVSCFYLGSTVSSQINQAAALVLQPVLPTLVTMDALEDKKRLRSAFLRSGRYGVWVAMLIAGPLIVFHREVIALYVGEAYAKAGTVMMLLLLLVPMIFSAVLLPSLAFAKAQVRRLAIYEMIFQSANLILTLFLVGGLKWGAVGSATATLVTTTLGGLFLTVPLALKLADVSLRKWLSETFYPGIVPAAGTMLLLEAARIAHSPDGWIMLGTYALCGGILNLGLIVRVMNPADREFLDRGVGKLRNLVLSRKSEKLSG